MAITITDIVTEYGAIYRDGGQSLKDVLRALMVKSYTADKMRTIVTDNTEYQASKALMTRIIQSFQKGFTPVDALSFEPSVITTYKMKYDLAEYPDELEASWLGFLVDKGENSRAKWPFIKWFIEDMIIPKMHEDIELYEIFSGVYAAPVAGTAGAQGASMTGLKSIIADAITAGSMTAIATGILSADPVTFVEQIEAYADAINTKYWNVPMDINMSQTLQRRFFRGYKEKYGTHVDYKQNKSAEVPFTNLNVDGLPSMAGSSRIFATPAENFVKVIPKKAPSKPEIEQEDRKVKVYGDIRMGVGFLVHGAVFPNDQV